MQASDWIKCSERMPELEKNVVVWTRQWNFQKARYMHNDQTGEYFWYLGGYPAHPDQITHWMPIVGPDEDKPEIEPELVENWEDDQVAKGSWLQ